MRIRFVREWRRHRVGQVVEFDHAGAADVLIRRGIAVLADGTAPAGEPVKAAAAATGQKTGRKR